jgi:hypothetical protein
VLTKEPKGRDVGEDDVFTINDGFRNKGIRVKLSAVSSQKEGEAEHIETRQKVRGRGLDSCGGELTRWELKCMEFLGPYHPC